MKKTFLLLLIMSGMLQVIQAQTTTIQGVVIDSISRQPEQFATIRIYPSENPDNAVVMGITDMEGRFSEEMGNSGSFTLLVTSVGRQPVSKPFVLNGEAAADLGTILVADDVQLLQDVEVVAQKPLVRMEVDRMTYKVADDVDAKSSTVLEMLRKVPMVTVDGQGNIMVNGSSRFKVYVDGKQNVMISSNPSMALRNMPASMIKDIEVITNPGARYDAEGVGGVLNLITNKAEAGAALNNSNNGYNATLRGEATTQGYGGGVYLNAQHGKLAVSVNGTMMYQDISGTEIDVEREQLAMGGASSFIKSHSVGTTKVSIPMGTMNVGYQIDTLRTLSASFSLSGMPYENNALGTTRMTGPLFGNGNSYSTRQHNKDKTLSINGNVDYQRSFAGNSKRMLILSYLISSAPTDTEDRSLFSDVDASATLYNLQNRFTSGRRNTLEQIVQADYSEPIHAQGMLHVGVKYTNRNNSATQRFHLDDGQGFVYHPEGSLDYRHRSNILAGYAEYEGSYGKIGVKGGLRYEHTWQDVAYKLGNGEDFSLRYDNLVPSASVSYTIAPTQNIGLTYNMRIARPGITYLNPYVNTSNPTAVSYGNSYLETEQAHNISAVYNFFSAKWMINATLRHAVTNNAISEYSFQQDNLLHTTYGNIVKDRQWGLNLFVMWNAGAKTRLYTNSGVTYASIDSPALQASNHGWSANALLGFQQTLPADLRLSLNAIYNTKSYTLQGWGDGFSVVTGSVTRSFQTKRGNKIDVSATFLAPLAHKKLIVGQYDAGEAFRNRTKLCIPLRQVGLSLSYTFGKQSVKAQNSQSHIVNDDEKNKQSNGQTIGRVVSQ